MFRDMRRNNQIISSDAAVAVLNRNASGVLAVHGDDNYPYAVPINYVYANGKLYFHCAKTGHKLDAIAKNSNVSFCVIDEDTVIPEKYTTLYRSVIAFGKARILTQESQIKKALKALAQKYAPNQIEQSNIEIEKYISSTTVVEICIEHLSGKESLGLRENQTK